MLDRNQELATGHLEEWIKDNAAGIAAIAKRLASYHIARAVPDPADHLRRASNLLRLARGAAPGDEEARETSAEFDTVNAALQEQILREGDTQIAWNSAMSRARLREGPGRRARRPPSRPGLNLGPPADSARSRRGWRESAHAVGGSACSPGSHAH
jgi:hypothetical protein